MRHPLRTVLLSLAADVVLVVVFAAIGRLSHHEAVLPGLLETAWPFLAGLALGWLISLAWRAPLAPVRTGLPVWALTVAAGMVLRAVSGQGVALGRQPLVNDLIQSGALVAPFRQTVVGSRAYFIIRSQFSAGKPQVRAFAEWLVAEAGGNAEKENG